MLGQKNIITVKFDERKGILFGFGVWGYGLQKWVELIKFKGMCL